MEWNQLIRDCSECRSCSLAQTRTHLVFGSGDPRSEIIFIGEGPGEQEDIQGLPFVGASGKLLDQMFAIIDVRREDVFITNIVKCRPPHNRDPLDEEKEACSIWLRRQLEYISPKIIVCLGRIAAQRLISPDFRITREHGKVFQRDTYSIVATFHPSALLRDPGKLEDAFDDLKTIQQLYLSIRKR